MKLKILLCSLLVFLLAIPLGAKPPKGKQTNESYATTIDNTTAIDVNLIYMFVTNHGNFGRDLAGFFGYDYGTWYPYSGNPDDILNNVNSAGDHTPNYASGIWMGGKVNGVIRVAISEYESEFVPGPMLNGTFQDDVPMFQVYKLYTDSLKGNGNEDYEGYDPAMTYIHYDTPYGVYEGKDARLWGTAILPSIHPTTWGLRLSPRKIPRYASSSATCCLPERKGTCSSPSTAR